jgi:hypothetical protein
MLTLTKMAEGGIRDHLGGGFCRYSVDGQWSIPHFEKMLYDNGPLLRLYADAWLVSGDPLYRQVCEETAAWVMREMQAPEGGYRVEPRRRFRGRGRQVLRLGSRRSRASADAAGVGAGATALGLRRPAELRESPLARQRLPARWTKRTSPCSLPRAKSFSPPAKRASAPGATTRC